MPGESKITTKQLATWGGIILGVGGAGTGIGDLFYELKDSQRIVQEQAKRIELLEATVTKLNELRIKREVERESYEAKIADYDQFKKRVINEMLIYHPSSHINRD